MEVGKGEMGGISNTVNNKKKVRREERPVDVVPRKYLVILKSGKDGKV